MPERQVGNRPFKDRRQLASHGGRLDDHLGDRPEKRPPSEAGGERGPISQEAPRFCPTTWNDRSTEHPAPMKDDLPLEPLLLKAGDVAKLLGLGRSKVFAML